MKSILLLAMVLCVIEGSKYYGINVRQGNIRTLERFKKLMLTPEIQGKNTFREVIRLLNRNFGSEDGGFRATVTTPPTTTTTHAPPLPNNQATMTAAPETDPPTTSPTISVNIQSYLWWYKYLLQLQKLKNIFG